MKPAFSNAIVGIILLGLLGFIGHQFATHGEAVEEAAQPPEAFRGTFVVQREGAVSTALRFLGNGQVESLANGVPYAMSSYTVEGNRITMTHSCGVSYYKISSRGITLEQNGWYFERSRE